MHYATLCSCGGGKGSIIGGLNGLLLVPVNKPFFPFRVLPRPSTAFVLTLVQCCNPCRRMLCWCQEFKATKQILIDTHYSTKVIKLAAVVWCAKHCYERAIVEKLVSIFDYHMCPTNKIHVVFCQKLIYDTFSKAI